MALPRPSTFRHLLRAELARRCARDERYSLRAFAQALDVDAGTLSQVLRGARAVSPELVRSLGARLGLADRMIDALGAEAADAHAGVAAEAAQVVGDPLHQAILGAIARPGFVPGSTALATALGVGVDAINLAVQRLIRLDLLAMTSTTEWRDVHGLGALDVEAFEAEVWRLACERLDRDEPAAPAAARDAAAPAPVTQFQYLSAEPGAAAAFYAALFGWQIRDANALGYREIAAAADGIAGGFWPAPPGVKSFVQLYVRVADVDAAVARAGQLGARVLMPPQTLPDGQRLAVLHDPQGVAFGLTD